VSNTQLYEDFLSTLYGALDGRVSVWWREQPGSKSPYSKSAWFSWPSEKDDMLEFIESVSDKDVCVTTATYGIDRRIPEHVAATHAIWMDSDVCSGDRYRVAPTWSVSTSQGRWQHFWALSEGVDAMRASELVHRISIAHDKDGADQSSWPSNKIMRVPGTMNTSHGFPTRVKGESNGLIYDIEDIESAYGDVVIPDRALIRDIPELSVDELPTYGNVLAKLNSDLVDLATTEPKPDQDRSRLRYKLLLELFRAGLSYEEVLSVAWHAPASRKWSEEDARGLSGLAGEAMKAAAEFGTPRAEPVDPFTADSDDDVELAIDKPVIILTEDERKTVEKTPTFIDKYLAYATKRLPHDNRSYDRLLAWELLSLAYMDSGYIPRPNGRGRLNFFGCLLGDTTTGKTSSFWLQKSVTRELFHSDPDFNIGGNASETALVKALHARDGKVSYFNSDEASGVLKVWVGQDWTAGMRERITELYDGEVNPLLRAGKGESITKTSTALFNVFLAGTQRGIMEYLTADLFHSGFIPRFIFAIGNPRRTDYNSYKVLQGDEKEALSGFDPVARQFAAELRANRAAIREFHGGEAPIMLDDFAAKRLQDAAYALDREYRGHMMWEMIQPSIIRWQVNVHKAACLLAMDDKRTTVNLTDMLHALAAGEEWFTNMLRIISRLNANSFERACSDIHAFVNGRGGRVGKTALFRRFKQFTDWEMQNYLKSLQNQRRVWPGEGRESGREYYYSDAFQVEK
jgi:hypothetical protein